jgi:drug/metabolite transporter (DMT)-like permease
VTPAARGRLYILYAALAWSTAGVLQRELGVDVATQLLGRASFATLTLIVFVAVTERGRSVSAFVRMGWAELGFAVCMGGSSAAFIVALNHTTVANVLLFQAVSPFVAALLAWVLLHEHVGRRTVVAMAIALVGVAAMVGGPGGATLGVAIAGGMSVLFAVGLVFARHRADISMGPATCLAQLGIVVLAAPFSRPGTVGAHDLAYLIGLGVGQIGLGLVFLALGARLIPAAEVALISLLEVVLGPLWVWLADGERPATATLVGGAVVVVAVAIQATAGNATVPRRASRRLRKDVGMEITEHGPV